MRNVFPDLLNNLTGMASTLNFSLDSHQDVRRYHQPVLQRAYLHKARAIWQWITITAGKVTEGM